jgi:DNA-binding response OmpR family regulator
MKKILIAEDSSVIQNLIKKVLSQSKNFEFVTVKNGEALIELLDKNVFDLFLIDINIPKVDGISCLKIIKANANHKDKPVLAITGNANNYTPADFTSFGFDDFLIKPLNFDALVQKVNELLIA